MDEAGGMKMYRSEHQSNSGAWFKVLQTSKGYVWCPLSCFLASNFRGPFKTAHEAVEAGKVNWEG